MKKFIYSAIFLFGAACAGNKLNQPAAPPPQELPVIQLNTGSATTWQEYPATIEGSSNIEIRPQVGGLLEKIYVEEGVYVSEGAPLFRINSNEYQEQANSADASIQSAKAAIEKAQLEIDRIKPLVANKVVAEVQLKTAEANLRSSKAAYAQAVSAKGAANITVGYTLIKAPVSGYIGHIPYKQGSRLSQSDPLPLTVLSAVNNVHVYFSMSENDYLHFLSGVEGKTTEEKISHLPLVELQLPDNSIYHAKGKVELVQGQFDKDAGTISFRVNFPNDDKQLRSGLTGKIRIPTELSAQVVVPQEATYEVQDKIFVFALGDSNKVASKQILVSGKSGTNYLVSSGITPGEKIVFSGLQRLRDGAIITPQQISLDSTLRAGL